MDRIILNNDACDLGRYRARAGNGDFVPVRSHRECFIASVTDRFRQIHDSPVLSELYTVRCEPGLSGACSTANGD